MLLEKIGYIGEIVSISGRTTGDVACGGQLLCANYYPDLDTPSYRKYQRQKTGCILHKENTPRNLNLLCYDNIVIPLLTLLSQRVESTIGTTIVRVLPTDGLRDIWVVRLSTIA